MMNMFGIVFPLLWGVFMGSFAYLFVPPQKGNVGKSIFYGSCFGLLALIGCMVGAWLATS